MTLPELRRTRGWSQHDLARRLAVDPATVRAWERGAMRPNRRHQHELAVLFAVTPDAITFTDRRTPAVEPKELVGCEEN
jgi:ribosome-binding protein aMBF1 (putative translation factor)